MVACQFEDIREGRETEKVKISTDSMDIKEAANLGTESETETVINGNRNIQDMSSSHKYDIADRNTHKKKKKFKPANGLYCFEVNGIFTSTKNCVTDKISRYDLDYSDVDHYFDSFEPNLKIRCDGLKMYRSKRKTKLQKVHTQIRDEHFYRSKCVSPANGRTYHIKQRLITRQTVRKECVDENIAAHKNNIANNIKNMGIKLKGVCRPLDSDNSSAYHPKRIKFDEEEKRRKEPRRIVKKINVPEKKIKKEPRRKTHFKDKNTTPNKQIEFPEYALHEGNISNIVDTQTKTLIDLQYRDLTAEDMELLFKVDMEAVMKKSLDEQMNHDIAVVQKNIADAKQLEDKIRQDSCRMLELMMQLQFRELSPEDYELLLRLDETVKPKVATSKAIRSLKTLEVGTEQEGHCCLICMDNYVNGDVLKILPCEHMYHRKCIEDWLTTSSNKCPLDSVEVL